MFADSRQRNLSGLIWRPWFLALAVTVGLLVASSAAIAADDPEPSPLFGKSLETSVDRLAGTPAQSDPQPPRNRPVNPPRSAGVATDSASVCIYELVCSNLSEESLNRDYHLYYGDRRAYGACSTGVDCPEFVYSGFESLCLKWQFVACDSPMVAEIPYTIISCQCDTLATMPGTPTCFGEPTCPGSWTCMGEMTCTATCRGLATCGNGQATCEPMVTCAWYTCESNPTCPGVATCEPMTCPIIDSNSVCVYELVCATLSEEALEAWYSLHVGDHRVLGPCSTTACLR